MEDTVSSLEGCWSVVCTWKEERKPYMKKAWVLVPAILFMTATTSWAMEDDAGVEALWKSKCATCHGVGGIGDTPMGKKLKLRDLRSPEVQKMSDRDLYDLIAKGKE